MPRGSNAAIGSLFVAPWLAPVVVQPLHTCPEGTASSGMSVQSVCADGSVGASDVFILIAIVAVLVALVWIVWNWTRRRFQ